MDNVTFTLTAEGCDNLTGARITVTRTSLHRTDDNVFVVGECISDDGKTRVYALLHE